MLKKIILILFMLLSFFQIVNAQSIKVGIREKEPFSYKENGIRAGTLVKIWENKAKSSNIEYSYVEYDTFGKLIVAAKNKDVDLSIFQISNAKPLKVGIREREPFSYKVDGVWTGFMVDLWEKTARNADIEYSYVEYDTFGKMMDASLNNDVDLSIGNISITYGREKIYDFSIPLFNSGLNIVGKLGNNKISLFKSNYIFIYVFGFIFVLFILFLIANIYWLLHLLKGKLLYSEYSKDIVELFLSLLSKIKKKFGFLIIIIFSFIFFIFIIGYSNEKILFSSNNGESFNKLLIEKISVDDLVDNVGVINKSTSMTYLNEKGIETKGYEFYDDMYRALDDGEIDYIVADDPILNYTLKKKVEKKYFLIGELFKKEDYAFIYPNNSKIVKKIDISLLEIKEQGIYNLIYNKYFENHTHIHTHFK